MADPKDTERERIRNISEPQGFTFFAEATPSDQRYLGDPDDVAAIVREFCMEAYELRTKSAEGAVSGPEALAQLEAMANRYAGIFYGKEPGSYRTMAFNSAKGVGSFIKQRLGLTDGVEQAGYVLFMNTANQIFEAFQGHVDGTMDEETVRFRIEAAIDDTSRILLGLPPED